MQDKFLVQERGCIVPDRNEWEEPLIA
jgi:hypothetical protein